MSRIQRVFRAPAGLLVNAATGVAAWLLLLLLAGCALLVPVGGLGRPLLARVLVLVRALTGFQRARAARTLGHEIVEARRRDRTARDVAWLAVHAVVGPACLITIGLVSFGAVLSFAGVIVGLPTASPTGSIGLPSGVIALALLLAILAFTAITLVAVPLLHTLQARLTEQLLRPTSSLAGRVRELTESRAAAIDAQAAEVRRIERDLHDGAQARLIAVRMNLGLAKSASDPDQIRELVGEAWESVGQALIDLRDLVRGIHPPVLADRGLTGAIQAAALLCPIPVEIDIDLPARPAPPVESAVYFAAAEALTNVTKHSTAAKAWVRLRHEGGILRLTVGDDGRGGADPAAGTGLDGIRRRLSAFDGTLAVHSPPGGPSQLTMELPCALSSQKISHS
ncbi:sensor histidine kinase [Nonomuraea sp. NPDC049028]|uniref:sensor histidine kinase n=1 Tax=Nonomuraea sp. NPDC049028 TaxID=3364348 RepID=UPI0037174A75